MKSSAPQRIKIALQRRSWNLVTSSLHLALGVIFCFIIFPRIGEATSGIDPDGYGNLGKLWYTTGRFDSIEKAPLYPAFIALIARLTGGYSLWRVQAAQCLLSSATILILLSIFRRTLNADGYLARIAGLACAVYPLTLWYIPRLWTETFLTFGLALYTWTTLRLMEQPTSTNAALCGLAAGFIALSKGIALIFIPLTILLTLARFRRAGMRLALLFTAAALLWVAPWTWRNYQLTNAFLPIHTDSGYNFYLGNGFARHWRQSPLSYTQLKALTEQELQSTTSAPTMTRPLERDRALFRLAWQEIVAQPWFLVKKILIQSLTFWYLAADQTKSLATAALQFPIILLALFGIRRAMHTPGRAWILWIPIGGVMGVSVLIFAFARLSATIFPYIIGLAVYGIEPLIILPLKRLISE